MKRNLAIFVVGLTLFSMFFGGGNLVFPLFVGIKTSSPLLSTLGLLLSSVLLPFYGVLIGLYFKGDYRRCLGGFGKKVGFIFTFFLLFFWIPFGSAPRCNQLAYGAFCQMGGEMPLWVYSALYSGVVYFLTVRKGNFLGILGKVVTPLLIFFLGVLIYVFLQQSSGKPMVGEMDVGGFIQSIAVGYNTMDFIAAIFFSSAIITLLKDQQKEKFEYRFVRKACLIAVSLLSIVYVSMVGIGYIYAESLQYISGARLLAAVGHVMLGDQWAIVIFMIVSLSVLSTSMALALVFSDYLRTSVFKERVGHKTCLFISVALSFIISTVGFERLAAFIAQAMSVFYPLLLILTTYALVKETLFKKPPVLEHTEQSS